MATPNPTIFNNQHIELPGADLYRGNCLAVLPGLTGPFDAVVTDPPYSSGGQSKGSRSLSTGQKYLNSGSTLTRIFLATPKTSAPTYIGRRFGCLCASRAWSMAG